MADNVFHDHLPAFPGAQGYGALATGGRGGNIVCVTNLKDAGPGSFREAVSRPHRLVVFEVGGTIHLRSNISCSSDLTMLGQTAPGEGLTLYGHSVSFSGCSNVIVRYLRFREGIGGSRGKCSVNIAGGSDLIFDHVSIEWGRWDCLGLTRHSHDITVQYCLIGQGIAPQRFGALVDSVSHVTLSHNLWIDNKSRNPKAKGTVQYIDNIVYNWGVNGLVGGHSASGHQLDVIGNYFIAGPSSNHRFTGMFTGTDHVYQTDNFVDLNRNGRLDGHLITDAEFRASGGNPTFVTRQFFQPLIPVTIDPAMVAWQKVKATAGCSLRRDSVDQQLIAELSSLGYRGRLLQQENLNQGVEMTIADGEMTAHDHPVIPRAWLVAHHLNPHDPRVALGDYNHNGYINLEKYANGLVKSAQ